MHVWCFWWSVRTIIVKSFRKHSPCAAQHCDPTVCQTRFKKSVFPGDFSHFFGLLFEISFSPPNSLLWSISAIYFRGQSWLKCKCVEPTNVTQSAPIKASHSARNESRKTLFQFLKALKNWLRIYTQVLSKPFKLWPSVTRQLGENIVWG